ncbi:hypothetical protein [Yinghuangia sp. YIM S09857]|uniref:AbiJ-related protein n=1 Tax=Yinghuangia sp. YIM S09857 TaxID=3436929 RepID=UPI003F53B231
MTALAVEIGLPMPAEESGTKAERVQACLEALVDDDLLPIARRFLDHERVVLRVPDRFALEDAVWAMGPVTPFPGRARRDVAQVLDLDEFVRRPERFEHLLERFWHLDDDPIHDPFSAWVESTRSRRALLRRHVFRNRGDWTAEELFEQLGMFEAQAPRFGRFLEDMVAPSTLPDADAQARVVEALNVPLVLAGLRLEQAGECDGYPSFQLIRSGPGTAARRPKTLIFATHDKPDIRFRDVVDHDIEVLQGRDKVLVYDRPIGPGGLNWRDLQQWWQDETGIGDPNRAKTDLYSRLLESMPSDEVSPQRHMFRLYHRIHGPRVWTLPALLPEVWAHWDHKTKWQRGAQALLEQRMDFLLLLPHGHRVRLEVDGRHHYETSQNYERTVRADREMTLRGYAVYRFSSTELSDPHQADTLLTRFFTDLFAAHRLSPGAEPR